MDLLIVAFMIAAGCVVAMLVMIATSLAERPAQPGNSQPSIPEYDRLATALLFNLLTLGALSGDEARRAIRRATGLAAPVTSSIDVSSWGARFAQIATRERCAWLLETAVRLIAASKIAIPQRQYVALLDLSFALGFQTDALARLREQYGFEYVDPSSRRATATSDRVQPEHPSAPPSPRATLLRTLELEGDVTRQIIVSTYRKLANRYHPDRFHDATAEEQRAAARRFMEITQAYSALLRLESQGGQSVSGGTTQETGRKAGPQKGANRESNQRH